MPEKTLPFSKQQIEAISASYPTPFYLYDEHAKFGLTRTQLFDAYAQAHARGVRRFGLHAMVASNELDPHYFVETAAMLFDLVGEIAERLGIPCEFVNIGGGIGIPYRPEES